MLTHLGLRQRRPQAASTAGSRRLSMALRVLQRLGLTARPLRVTLLRLARPHLSSLHPRLGRVCPSPSPQLTAACAVLPACLPTALLAPPRNRGGHSAVTLTSGSVHARWVVFRIQLQRHRLRLCRFRIQLQRHRPRLCRFRIQLQRHRPRLCRFRIQLQRHRPRLCRYRIQLHRHRLWLYRPRIQL